MTMPPIALIGFGEAGRAIVGGWGSQIAPSVRGFDIKTTHADEAVAMWNAYTEHGITGCGTLSEALEGAQLVFSLVTADQAEQVAGQAADHIRPGALYFDGNSCAPGVKQRAAQAIEAAGGHYVDLAIMAPIHPRRHRTPMLVSGPHVAEALGRLHALDMLPDRVAGDIGAASTVKMLRSVMVKGMEALFAEMLLAASRAGVDRDVLASLQESTPGIAWADAGGYALNRMLVHGKRRAAEMEQVVVTLRDLGLERTVSERTASWQQALGDLNLSLDEVENSSDYSALIGLIGTRN